MAGRLRSILINTVLLLGSCTVSLAAMELVYRQFEPDKQRIFFYRSQYAFFQYDPLLGWANTPNTQGIFERRDFKTLVHVNSNGMRYHEVGEKQGFRAAVLGDSYVWGHGVEENQRFTEVLENRLKAQMLNFGVSGYGPVQYYLLLDKVISFRPDLVIIVFCVENDFIDSVNSYRYTYYKPYAALEEGKLVIKGYPIPDKRRFGAEIRPWYTQFALGRLLFTRFGSDLTAWFDSPHYAAPFVPVREGIFNVENQMAFGENLPEEFKPVLDINAALLKAIREKLEAHHIPLVVLAGPIKQESRTRNATRWLRQIAQQAGVEVIETREPMGSDEFLAHDDHWNANGHRKIADTLEPVILNYVHR